MTEDQARVITLRISEEEYQSIYDAAWASKRSMNQYIRDLLNAELQKQETES